MAIKHVYFLYNKELLNLYETAPLIFYHSMVKFSSQWCCTVCFLFPAVPAPPTSVRITETLADSVALTWTAPVKDGGAPITGYIVERRTGKHWIPAKTKASGTSFTVTDLSEGSKYEFRVLAENKMGQSKPSEPTLPIVAKNPWSECAILLH